MTDQKETRFTCKKILLLFIMLGLLLGMSGCGKEKAAEEPKETADMEVKTETDKEQQTGEIRHEGNHYKGEYTAIPEKREIGGLATMSGTIIYYAQYTETEQSTKLLKYDTSDGQKTEILDIILEGNSGFLGLCINSEGNLLLLRLMRAYAEEELASQYWLTEIKEDGSIIMDKDITELLEETGDQSMRYLAAGEDGRIYLSSGENVWVLDGEGDVEFCLETYSFLRGMGILPGGQLAVYESGSGLGVRVLDLEGQSWGHFSRFDRTGTSFSFTVPGGEGAYFYDDNALFSCDLETGETEVVADWMANDVCSEYIKAVCVQGDGSIRLITHNYDADTDANEVVDLRPAGEGPGSGKQTVTLGTIRLTGGVRRSVTDFNKKSASYRIETIEYGSGVSYSDGVARLNSAIIAGEMPDIINITDGTEDFYAAKGVLEDLKPYLDGEQGVDRADYFGNILEAMETDGKLYTLSPDFSIDTVIGRTQDVGEGYGWTMEDMRRLEESRPEGVEMFAGESKQGVLDIYLRCNMGQFFDLNTGLCDFDNDSFREVLEFVSRFPPSSARLDLESMYWPKIAEGELLLLRSELFGIGQYQQAHSIFNGDISAVGYPCGSGCGSVAKGGMVTVAMSAKSGNKEGAWAFIRSLLEEDYQERYTSYFPLLRSAFDKAAQASREMAILTKADGTRWEGEVAQDGYWIATETESYPGYIVEFRAATEEEVATVRGLIERIDRMERFDEKVLSIISEEAGAYFSGQKSVDEVVAIIQSRANIYMNEGR